MQGGTTMRSTLSIIALSAALGTATAAVAEVRIGASLAVTGPASFLGDPEAKTLEMLVEQINAAGGIQGEEIALTIYDDGGDPSKARTFATRLVEEDNVVAIIGSSTTGATMAMAPIVGDAEVPMISLAGGLVIIDPVQDYVFKTPHTDRMACQKVFEDIKNRGMSKVGIVSETGGFGASMREQCLDVAGDYGIEIVADETYGAADPDMTPQMTNVANTDGIEAILVAGAGQGPAVVTRNAAQLDIKLPLYQSHGVASNKFIELAGDSANGIRLPATALLIPNQLAQDDPQREVVNSYITDYSAKYGTPPSTFGGYAFDALNLLVEAMNAAGTTTDSIAIKGALENIQNHAGVTAVYNFTPENHMGLDPSAFRMLVIKDGGWAPAE